MPAALVLCALILTVRVIAATAQLHDLFPSDHAAHNLAKNERRGNHFYEEAVQTQGADCISSVRIDGMTGSVDGAHHLSKYGGDNKIKFIFEDSSTFQEVFSGGMNQNQPFSQEIPIDTTVWCFSSSDIKEVHLLAVSYIASINTYVKTGEETYELLTSDSDIDKWLDSDEVLGYYTKDLQLTLTWERRHVVDCESGQSVCRCRRRARECEFDLEIDEIRTFTSYHKSPSGVGVELRSKSGAIFYIDDNGVPQPALPNRLCSTFGNENCSVPQFVDGKTYRLALAINGQIPGPTIIVTEGQTVILHVKNNLTSEGISIHWHGMHQIGTPWMDGVGQVTQCQIGPFSTFQYKYLAQPSGTFWYHSHSGAQRTDGVFGSLIVQENAKRLKAIKKELQPFGLDTFEDLPGNHTLSLLDWQEESSLDLFTQINAGLGFYPGVPIGEVPTGNRYFGTRTYDRSTVGPVPYFSGLINGKGRHSDVPYQKTRLSIFYVESGKRYRFRLVGAQSLYAYKFSVDGHKLILIGTDGYWTRPVEEVDYIIIHTGERFDFFLEAIATSHANFWMRAETLEVDRSGGVPYPSLGHVAEAILHYKQPGDTGDPDIDVPSWEYLDIKIQSPPITCTSVSQCKAVNCPFQNFHSSYNIDCVNIQDLYLLEATPDDQLPTSHPDPHCDDCTHFINFSFEGDFLTSTVNGRNFFFPAYPPQTQQRDFSKYDTICNLDVDCNPSDLDCLCTHVISIPYKRTIQLVLSSIGRQSFAHPIHVHGHTFFVVHVGYPVYDDNGEILAHSTDIKCADVNCTKPNCNKRLCTQPSWNGSAPVYPSVNGTTPRKDTVIVPAGGYVVINFISDNPGYWFAHCHIEVHQLEGMALIINEAQKQQKHPPRGMNRCGDFIPGRRESKKEFNYSPDNLSVL